MYRKIFTGAIICAIAAAIACFSASSWAQREKTRQLKARITEETAIRKRNATEADLSAAAAKLRLAERALRSERITAAAVPAAHLERPEFWLRKSERDPTVQNLKFAADRAQLRSRYWPFLNSLHLPTEKVDAFLELSAEHNQQQSDIYASAEAEGISLNDPSILKLLQQGESDYATSLRGLMGDSGYTDFQSYQRTADVRDYLRGLSATAAMAGIAYTPEQSEQLVAALATASPAHAEGEAAGTYNIDWAKADLAVRSVLAPAQYDAYLHLEASSGSSGRQLSLLNQTIRRALASDKNRL